MHTTLDSEYRGRKKQRFTEEDHYKNTPVSQTEQYPPKTPKSSTYIRPVSKQYPPTTFWDNLSKVWLTRRALEEHNRRTPRPTYTILRNEEKTLPVIKDLELDKLKSFARSGGPDLCDIRGYPFTMPPGAQSADIPPQATTKTNTEKKSSTYDPNFEQIMIDHGSYPEKYRHPDGRYPPKPNNWNEIQNALNPSRASLSSSPFFDRVFDDFIQKERDASNERKTIGSLFSIIRGDADIFYDEDTLFRNLKPFADGIVNARPDLYDGARVDQLNWQVRKELNSYIIPSTQRQAPILPNFFTEGKGVDGSPTVAKRQAFYDGTLGARAMLQLQSYGNNLNYDNNAYTIVSTYHDGTLKLFTIHPTRSTDPGRFTDYHMNQLSSLSLTSNPESFREGVSAFRNARDWAKEQRDRFIMAANSAAIDM
ncbi:MAG: hypothetical protein M1834_005479 [Cirrosporium novae-zelandiae]|nr:MAG: hypothetical protein M1834_005479 [Cirrosporium novae-zelandiae]